MKYRRPEEYLIKLGRRQDQIGWDKVLTEAEQRQAAERLAAMNSDVLSQQIQLMYRIFVSTGLRASELAAMRVQDCPVYLGELAIQVWRGKNNKDRTIPVSQSLARTIEIYIKNIRKGTLPRWVRPEDVSKPMFYNSLKRPYIQIIEDETNRKYRASSTLYRIIRRLGADAGLTKRLHPHMLRHTFAVNSLKRGVDIYTLKELMGHGSITMTARYLHLAGLLVKGLGEMLDDATFCTN